MVTDDISAVSRTEFDALRADNVQLRNELGRVREENEALRKENAELRARLNRTSKNSSKPPSSDGYAKPPRVHNPNRKVSGRSVGKQPGATGAHLPQVDDPDTVIRHSPSHCGDCGRSLEDTPVVDITKRQVHDLPPIRILVAEHQAEHRQCGCGVVTRADFPADVSAPVQYGPVVRALAAYFCVYQHVPVDRAAQMFSDCFNIPIATGTVVAIIKSCAGGLGSFETVVRELLIAAPVAHFDETGGRIGGKLQWIHSASTQSLTQYTAHEKRGRVAMTAAGVLPSFGGIAVHDGWASYRGYGSDHGLCNAHHLRELRAVIEQPGQEWAGTMATLLVEIKKGVAAAAAEGSAVLDPVVLAGYRTRYAEIITTGHGVNPPPEPSGRRGRTARSPAANLLERLDERRDDVLHFARDFRVPWDNNLAERDIRMVKLQQKISGCWRTSEGAKNFCTIRSYISTMRKQRQNVLDGLRSVFLNDPWLPVADGVP